MSSYIKPTVNPDTHEIEEAEWLDDYFGQHIYGVRFPATGVVYKADDFEWIDDHALMAMRAVSVVGMVITKEQTVEGKRINIMEHDNGRKDVNIEVRSLDVDLSDPSNVAAKKVIEEQILPAIADKQIIVTVIHKPTNESASFVCRRKHVRDYAQRVVAQREDKMLDHYCLVQRDGDDITVTTL